MIVGRLRISFDRGRARNTADDLGLAAEPSQTTKGGRVCGLGTHFRSEDVAKLVAEQTREESRIRRAFDTRYIRAPIPGFYLLPNPALARSDLADLGARPDMEVSLTVYTLAAEDGLPPEELREWGARIQEQLKEIRLGRGNDVSAEGLACIENLAECPSLSEETRKELREILGMASFASKAVIKRRLSLVNVAIDESFVCGVNRSIRVEPTAEEGPTEDVAVSRGAIGFPEESKPVSEILRQVTPAEVAAVREEDLAYRSTVIAGASFDPKEVALMAELDALLADPTPSVVSPA